MSLLVFFFVVHSTDISFECSVIAIDIDERKIEMAKHNAEIYGVAHKIQFIVGDYLQVIRNLQVDKQQQQQVFVHECVLTSHASTNHHRETSYSYHLLGAGLRIRTRIASH